jgi:metal regulatory transcription factor 1
MVKHQRRSHQRGIHSSELDDGDTSDSEGESPATPQPSRQLHWPPNTVVSARPAMPARHQIHRAHSFADFGQQQLDGFPLSQAYGHRHSLSGGNPAFNSPIPEQNPMMARAPSLPAHSSYYVPEQNNPGIATLNTNPSPLQTYHIPRHQHSQEMLQSSPSSYSPLSRASPIPGEPYYAQPTAQVSTYSLRNSPSAEQQPAVQFQQMAHHLAQQQYQSAPPQEGQWYDNVAYQSPIEVVSQMQAYQAQIASNPWMQKIEAFDDISLQMPSMRIENL